MPEFPARASTSPNRAAAEIDIYGGIRPTFRGKLALDGGFWYYYYPDGQCFNTAALCGGSSGFVPLPNGNVIKQRSQLLRVLRQGHLHRKRQFQFRRQHLGSPSVLNSGAYGIYYTGNVTFIAPSTWLMNAHRRFAPADIGYWQLGHGRRRFYAVPAFRVASPTRAI